jgi:hypothetical protein
MPRTKFAVARSCCFTQARPLYQTLRQPTEQEKALPGPDGYSRGWTNSRWCTRVDADVGRQLVEERNEWAHYEQGTGPAEAGITTYGDQCATAAGNAAPVVANKVRADVIEDTIEMYVLDLAMHERLPEGCEEMDEYDESLTRRSLRTGEGLDSSINHGHFRKWRICIEKEARKRKATAFWEADMGQNDANKKVWNKALRATQSFTRATGESPSPKVIRFDLLRNRVQEEQQAEIQIAAVMGKNTDGEMANADATEIERLRGVQRRCRTVLRRCRARELWDTVRAARGGFWSNKRGSGGFYTV